MSALANILYDEGHYVEGMDVKKHLFTQNNLKMKDIFIHSLDFDDFSQDFIYIIGHNFIDSDIVVKLKDKGCKLIEYHLFIKQYIEDKNSVAICGTHGKTTTTGMMVSALNNFDISYLIGDGTGKGNINSKLFVFEACEYKDHFLAYRPSSIIITNIDYDHVDYFLTKRQYIESFNNFIKNTKNVYILYDDKDKIEHENIITFGTNINADYACINYNQDKYGIKGIIIIKKERKISFELPFFGEHNLLHVLAVIAYLDTNGFNIEDAIEKLAKFSGVKRRLTKTIINDDVFIDDYAHHPNEIMATIKSVRAMYPSHKVIVFFKPDRLSRLLNFKDDFITVLNDGDQSFVLPLYEAVDGYHDSRILCNQKNIFYLEDENKLKNFIFPSKNIVFLMMSSKELTSLMKTIVKIRESEH